MNKKGISAILLAFLFTFFLTGCLQSSSGEYKKEFFALNTIIDFTVYGDKRAEKALEKALARVNEIENRMSTTIPESDVSRINQNAGKQPVKVHDDTFFVIKKALEYAKLTDGAFDITIYPIVQLWGITTDHPKVPTWQEIAQRLSLVDYRQVRLNEQEKTVYLTKEGMGIDLGAIAKGYAADEVARIFREAGVKHALINMGGNVVVVGDKPNGTSWRIGIRDPRSEETGEQHFAVLEVQDRAVVSSGDYERYIKDAYEKTGIRYHHIFDPKTGYPARSGLMATTIVSSSSIDADALSTIVFILGADKGLKLVNTLKDVQALAVSTDKQVYTTDGFANRIKISNGEYKLAS